MPKFEPEEFIVEEITKSGEILKINTELEKEAVEGDFTYFALQKRKWNTVQAIRKIAKALHISHKRFSFAGTKDRNAITTQLISAFKVEPQKLRELRIRDIKILGAWKEKEKLKMGDLLGNAFTIKFEGKIKNIKSFPNFFGGQRFGSIRKNTAKIGKLIIKGKFKEAVLGYISAPGDEFEQSREARENFRKTLDTKKALKEFPKFLKYERTLLGHLQNYPTDYIGALRKLPRKLQLMFVHAYQSELFNKFLEKRLKEKNEPEKIEVGEYYCRTNFYNFPETEKIEKAENEKQKEKLNEEIEKNKAFVVGKIIGYESELNNEEKELLKKEGIEKEEFKIKSVPELSCKGNFRVLFSPIKNLNKIDSEHIYFEIPAGAYATVALKYLAASRTREQGEV